LDSDNDHKIGYKEFVKGLKMLSNWGIDISDPKSLWKEADKDGGGQILFVEFVDWAISKNLDLEDDDDEV
jgi:Ca2+-binding EF-hand superfamily protein